MNDQKWLKEIKKRYADDLKLAKYAGIELTGADYSYLIRQAEEKQELEGVAKDRYRDWEKLEQQNKRYETAFRRIKRDYAVQNVDYIPVTALYEIQLIIDQALQNNREG